MRLCGVETSLLPTEEQGVTVLGTPTGHPAFVQSRLAAVSEQHDQLVCLDLVALLRCSPAELHFAGGASGPDCKVRGPSRCVSPPSSEPTRVSTTNPFLFWDVVGLPFSRGGLGLRSAVLTTNAACWSSWADSLQMIQARSCTNCPTGTQLVSTLPQRVPRVRS